MNNERIILGLDIGVGSVGWGLVKLTEEKYYDKNQDETSAERYRITEGKIIDTGIRTFQLPQDQKGKSLAAKRGQARRGRWTKRRKARRLKQLVNLAKEFDLISENYNRDQALIPKKGDKKEKWDIWRFRKEALERKLTDNEFFRVLYYIAKHRGAYFHTKAEFLSEEDEKKLNEDKKQKEEKSEAEKENEKVKSGLRKIEKMLRNSRYRTIGALFYEMFKNERKRNAPDKYEHSIRRELLRDEIIEIFKEQQRFGNNKAKKEFKQRYIEDILMKEEGIDEEKLQNMMSRCEFTGRLCAPMESYTAERFKLFNRINTLELIDMKNKNKPLALKDGQRSKIENLAYTNAKVTFAQIRAELELQDELHIRFNLCSYKESDPEYNKKLVCEVKNGQLQFDESHKVPIVNINTKKEKVLDGEIKKILKNKKLWPKAKNIYVYYSDIRKQLNLPDNYRFKSIINEKKKQNRYTKSAVELGSESKYIKQFEDDSFVELKGYHKIKRAIEEKCGSKKWGQISGDISKLNTIAEALTYCKSDKTRTDYLRQQGVADAQVIEAVLAIDMKKLATYSKEALNNLLKYMEKGALHNEAKEKCGYGKIDYKKQFTLEPYSGFFENNPVVARVISQTRKLINAIVRKYNENYPIDQIHIEIATDVANSKKRKIEIAQGQKRYKDAKEAAEDRCREFGLDPEEGQNLVMVRFAGEQYNKCPYTGKTITFYPATADNEVNIRDCQIDHVIPMSRSFNDSLNNKVICAPEANQNKRDRIPFEWFEDKYGKDSQQWTEFENTVKKMHRMPYPKRKNLIRKSWTEKDKEKFLSRNLNDTRYAARHIADYLRKYFDFSISERDDIKDVSKIKVRSGGITAFLRYMWGLNKNREENDLHHALDALVVACSTDGHVYLVSNLAKEIERKGKNWYKHFDFIRNKFKPWTTVREDIQTKVNNVFISRMPRHKITAEAHKETIETLKKIPSNKRVVKVNKGYAEMGDMVRADVFTDDIGKNYVVPIYSTDIFANKPLPDKYVPDDRLLSYDKWPSVLDKNLEFRFSLFKDDLISINDKKYYVSFLEATTANVNVKNIDGSIFPDKKDAQDPKTKKIKYRPKRGKCVLKKYSVDMLGNYKEIKQEKRQGNRLKKSF
jgi:CRISPR subtype II RNA-guided endonuclease Cas9/Csn1